MDKTQIAENVLAVRNAIEQALQRAGRKDGVTLIGVTKTIALDRIQELIACGVTELGENRVQELMGKQELITGVNWHLIGRLQTNKVKYVVGKCRLIHSVDSLSLAAEISKRAEARQITQDILIEVNIAAEQSKAGVKPEECLRFAEEIRKLKGIHLTGLMCVAPDVDAAEKNRLHFRRMAELVQNINKGCKETERVTELSMGMTNDYAVAVEEGATMVRVGSAIFGQRPMKEERQ